MTYEELDNCDYWEQQQTMTVRDLRFHRMCCDLDERERLLAISRRSQQSFIDLYRQRRGSCSNYYRLETSRTRAIILPRTCGRAKFGPKPGITNLILRTRRRISYLNFSSISYDSVSVSSHSCVAPEAMSTVNKHEEQGPLSWVSPSGTGLESDLEQGRVKLADVHTQPKTKVPLRFGVKGWIVIQMPLQSGSKSRILKFRTRAVERVAVRVVSK
jgi:hypothetical protein